MNGVSSVFFMSNSIFCSWASITWSIPTISSASLDPTASYTIVPIIMDIGYQGLQSSFNNLWDLCSVGRIPGLHYCERE